MLPKIDSFDGPYRFLSNFHKALVLYRGTWFPSTEHAYQAAKSTDPAKDWPRFRLPQVSCGDSKRMGSVLLLRLDWEEVKLQVMQDVVHDKFTRHPTLGKRLLDTGDAELIEGNTWGDTYWGVCRGTGENHLGKILMDIRAEIRDAVGPT